MKIKIVFLTVVIFYLNIFSFEEIGNFYGKKEKDLKKPVSLKVDKKDNIYILDFVTSKLVAFNDEFKVKFTIEDLKNPTFFSIIDQKIFITESLSSKIKIYDLNTGFKLGEFGSKGMRELEFKNPSKIYKYENEFYIIDDYNFRIQVLNEKNVYLRQIFLPFSFKVYKSYYSNNYDILFLNKKMYVLDVVNKKIYIYKREKKEEKEINLSYMKRPSKFFFYNDYIYILDNFDKKIYRFLKSFKKKEDIIVTQKKDVELLTVNDFDIKDEYIYMIFPDGIYRFSLDRKKLKLFYKIGRIKDYEFINPTEIKTDINGNIYVLDQVTQKIIIFDKDKKLKKVLRNIGDEPSGFFIDSGLNLFVNIFGENKILKYDMYGKKVVEYGDYKEFEMNYDFYLKNLDEEELAKEEKKSFKFLRKSSYFNFKIFVDEKGYIYVLNGKEKKIIKYDSFFNKITEYGKKASLVSLVLNKESETGFGWDADNNNTISDFFVYKNKVYVIDNYYNRIFVFDENGEVKIIKEELKDTSPRSIYIKDDMIYICDSKNFKLIKYNMKFEFKSEYNLLEKGYIPLKFWDGYMIIKFVNKKFEEEYRILDLKEFLDDKNKKLESSS